MALGKKKEEPSKGYYKKEPSKESPSQEKIESGDVSIGSGGASVGSGNPNGPASGGSSSGASGSGMPKPEDNGPSSHTTNDRWAETDTLGYWVYVDAIYNFLTHPETKAPLTISVQAPWGGGKTSMMRMIQGKLDYTEYKRTLDEIHGNVNDEKNQSL